ncbi:hypothetical protein, partial [Sulfitobacter sp.]|uniref:hypothetical protein n=1 Tax=Sulfitobacter sp. TaxID=1903071 RepID=UPI0030010854
SVALSFSYPFVRVGYILARCPILPDHFKGCEGSKRGDLTRHAWENGADELFESPEQLYTFLKRKMVVEIFDSIENGQE